MRLQQRHGKGLWRQIMWRHKAWAAHAAPGAHPHRARAASLWSMGCRSAVAPLVMDICSVRDVHASAIQKRKHTACWLLTACGASAGRRIFSHIAQSHAWLVPHEAWHILQNNIGEASKARV